MKLSETCLVLVQDFIPIQIVLVWSWANFSSTLDRKHSNVMRRKSEGKDGANYFFRAKMRAFFQLEGKTPLTSDALHRFVRWWQLLEKPITLWGIPSSPLACDLKCETTSMTSCSDTSVKRKPSSRAADNLVRYAAWSPDVAMAIPEKFFLSSFGMKPCSASLGMSPRLRVQGCISFQKFFPLSRVSPMWLCI